MRVPQTDLVLPLTTAPGGPVLVRVSAGNVASLPLGALLEATVTEVRPREAVLRVNDQTLTVRPGTGFQVGTVLLVRVPPPQTGPALELVAQVAAAPAWENPSAPLRPRLVAPGLVDVAASEPERPRGTTPNLRWRSGPDGQQSTRAGISPTATPPTQLLPPGTHVPGSLRASGDAALGRSTVSLLDVVAVLPDGRVRVRLDGLEQIVPPTPTFTPGSRFIVQVERTPGGLVLRPVPDSPELPSQLATAILRGSRPPDLGTSLRPLLVEVNGLVTRPQPERGELPTVVREAATAVRETLRTFLPAEPRPPVASELRALVANGGLHFEAKLARAAEPSLPASEVPVAKPHTTPEPDLKGDLLRILQAVQDVGSAVPAPVARGVVEQIEAQQAVNVLAQETGSPYFLQVPFPDGSIWRTLHLSLNPESRSGQPDGHTRGGFRLLMHVPLEGLGETWIDAGITDDRFRAVMYLDRAEIRERVNAELGSLREELRNDGFSEVLLGVRSTADLPIRQRHLGAAMLAGRPDTVSVIDVKV